MRDADYSLWATEAAVATGLPVWVGIATEPRADGELTGFARPDWPLDDIVPRWRRPAPMSSRSCTRCPIMWAMRCRSCARHWQGPLGAYPESGFFKMPDWQFVDIIAPAALVAHARDWQKTGASIFGGCCGTNPQHIKALRTAFEEISMSDARPVPACAAR